MVEGFVRNESKTLEEYERMIKHYHDLMVNIPLEIERTAFTGLFKVSRQIFIQTIVENVDRVKRLLTDSLVSRYQSIGSR